MIIYDFATNQWCGLGASEEYTVDTAKQKVLGDISDFALQLRAKYCVSTSPYEAASWALKKSEAEKYKSSNKASDAPMLQVEANARAVTLDVMVDKVLSASNQLSTLEAIIAGTSGRHRDAVSGLTTLDEVLNYDWSSGWPL